jgi:biotin carboxyl carrier protein
MKYIVTIDGKRYQVELSELHTNPVVAIVDGQPVEVYLESEGGVKPYFAMPNAKYTHPTANKIGYAQSPVNYLAPSISQNGAPRREPVIQRPAPQPGASSATETAIRAPIPGVVLSLSVKPGDEVQIGQELLLLEAMKMKNKICAPRAGVIARLHVNTGQAVQHHDLLLEFES